MGWRLTPSSTGRAQRTVRWLATVRHVMTFPCQEPAVSAGLLRSARIGAPRDTKLGWQVMPGVIDCHQPEGRLDR
ncbi:MAG: hypothetical protein JO023_03630 [Chloroflexi bacterium]|nr:hypothetical protein [Chloroflexota bacterium]